MKTKLSVLLSFCLAIASFAQAPAARQPFVRVDAPVIALMHVRVIDGTGAAGDRLGKWVDVTGLEVPVEHHVGVRHSRCGRPGA